MGYGLLGAQPSYAPSRPWGVGGTVCASTSGFVGVASVLCASTKPIRPGGQCEPAGPVIFCVRDRSLETAKGRRPCGYRVAVHFCFQVW